MKIKNKGFLMIKECKKHGLSEYRNSRCKKCASESVMKRRKELLIKSIDYKGGCCKMCGYNKCLAALEFHHLDPKSKVFSISVSGNTRSWERIKEELDKCILLCVNCHRELHEQIRIEEKRNQNERTIQSI